MREAVFSEFGDPGVLQIVNRAQESPASDEVAVRVVACGLNHLDLDIRMGLSRFEIAFPHRLGREIVGFIEAIGGSVSGVTIGTLVLVLPVIPCGACEDCQFGQENLCSHALMPGINMPGGYGDYVNVPARGVMPLAADQDPCLAAATPITFGTAWRMLVTLARAEPGETVLVNGATGGLGTALVQIAALLGLVVLGSTGVEEKKDYVLQQGAGAVINHRKEDLAEEVLRLTRGRGVDIAVDCVGGSILSQTLTCMAPRGRIITGGGHTGEVVAVDIIQFFRKELQMLGSRSQTLTELETVMSLLQEGKIKPHVHRTYELEEAESAHRLLESRQFTGKIVICP